MKIYAQHGFKASDKVWEGLRNHIIDGVIYGAKDISPSQLQRELVQVVAEHPESTRLFDPHYYATLIASDLGARLGNLVGDDGYPYFHAHMRRDLEQTDEINKDIRACLEFQAGLDLTAFISPNIVIRRSFDSIEGVIAKNFIRNSFTQAKKINSQMPVYATLAVSEKALGDMDELSTFLQEITEMNDPPLGFYLLLEKPDTTPPPYLVEQNTLTRWMLVNYALKINGFEVINGYTDLLAPYIAATGADAVGTGWFGTLKSFSLQRFRPPISRIIKQPIPRYTSVNLLKSIRYTEYDSLRQVIPEVFDGEPDYDYYPQDRAPTPVEEILQNWEALRAMITRCAHDQADVSKALRDCAAALDVATECYAEIDRLGIPLRDRSNSQHINVIREELDEFKKLAEL